MLRDVDGFGGSGNRASLSALDYRFVARLTQVMMTIYGNSSGFDPSLCHDDDGRKYLVNMLWDHRPGHNPFAGIVLQEHSVAHRALIGSRTVIFTGTPIGFTEGPHLTSATAGTTC